MISRSLWAATAAVAFSLAACQSVHTQNAPTPTPSSLDQPVSMTLGAPVPGTVDGAAATPTATPSPPAAPAKLTYSMVPGVGRTIAMTFDDGPSPKLTPPLLDMLKARGIRATFFVVGQNAAEYPDILRRAAAEGHEIASHSWSHPQLTRLSAAAFAAQIDKTNAAIKAAIGHNPAVMRPPYGATNAALDRRLNREWGLKVILWDVDPLDWKYRNAARVQRTILEQVKPGSIVLAHDIHASTVAAMPGTLDALIARGYKFATVSELIAMEGSQGAASPEAPAAPAPVAAATPEPTKPASAEITAPPTSAPAATPFTVERYTPGESSSEGSAPR